LVSLFDYFVVSVGYLLPVCHLSDKNIHSLHCPYPNFASVEHMLMMCSFVLRILAELVPLIFALRLVEVKLKISCVTCKPKNMPNHWFSSFFSNGKMIVVYLYLFCIILMFVHHTLRDFCTYTFVTSLLNKKWVWKLYTLSLLSHQEKIIVVLWIFHAVMIWKMMKNGIYYSAKATTRWNGFLICVLLMVKL